MTMTKNQFEWWKKTIYGIDTDDALDECINKVNMKQLLDKITNAVYDDYEKENK